MKKFFIYLGFLALLLISRNSIAAEIVEIEISIKDHKFQPDTIEVPSGKKIRLIVHNMDNTIEEFESIELKREKIILSNSSANIILAPLKPGKYNFFGEFHQETAQGCLIVN